MSVPPDVCFICRSTIQEGPVIVIKKRGILSLINASVKRGLQENQNFLQQLSEVTVHDACRKRYTVESNVKSSVRRGEDLVSQVCNQPSLRSSSGWNLQRICFLCGEEVTEEYIRLQQKLPYARRNHVHKVEMLNVRTTILQAAERRDDEWGQNIIERLTPETDLVAADARYHHLCYKRLFSKPSTSGQKRGHRPANDVDEAMEYIYSYLWENREECQFSLDELLKQIKGKYVPDTRTVKTHLKKRYGDDIMITDLGSCKGAVVCFKNIGHKILYDNWYGDRKNDVQQERLRIVKAAAEIILEDIRSKIYDNNEYPPSDDFLRNLDFVVPESVQLFFETIVLKHKHGSLNNWKKKCVAFSHALISAVRPRSFISSLMTGVGTYLYKKFGSKYLVNLCSAMGFSCSYNEAMQLESSAIMRAESSPSIEKGALMQFVFDNADVNVNTLDGENTFHEMGGIMCITPYSAVLPDKHIPRLKKYVSADTVSSFGSTQIKQCSVRKNSGLSSISISAIQRDFQVDGGILPSVPDLLWLYGKWSNTPSVPGWNGFMEQVTGDLDLERSKIVFLPFIRSPPTDYDTVLTSLFEASEKIKAHSHKTCFVTFDQPLYMKARDIVQSGQHPELSSVVVRLGDFHLLMSFMGSIGAIMAGSGLKELFMTIYADHSVDKMLYGHAYSRAVRAHILTTLVLAGFILNEVDFTEEERAEIENMLSESERSLIMLKSENKTFQILRVKSKTALDKLKANGPTSKLWIQYYRMSTLMKQFIQAERMGDWNLHLDTICKMLPFFHSAGHFFYAKSAHLYLQDMMDLKQRMDPTEFDLFTKGGFTIRRSNKFWSGLWSDLTIEQTLMRSMKSCGRLTHGRGISSSVLARWTVGMVYMLNICEEVERFCNISCCFTAEHVDMRPSQIIRDSADVQKLKNWFILHAPFPVTDKLLSISSGVVGGQNINCHMARELGTVGVMKIVGNTFGNVTFKRKDKVLTLASINSSVKVANKRVDIDPLTIFQRVCITKQSNEELKDHFKYELAPYPLSLFSEQGMRKGTKSSFYSAFTPLISNIPYSTNTFVVVDGGYLLHKVVWHRNNSVRAIISNYVSYVKNHFGSNVSIVFDGYPEESANKNTKNAERVRRYAAHSCSDILFEVSTIIQLPQEKLLTNDNNKRRLIAMLCDAFERQDVEVKVAEEDADRDININPALSRSQIFDRVIVIGEDVDLLVLLNGLGSAATNVYLQKSGRRDVGCVHFSSSSYTHGATQYPHPHGTVLFIHAFSGCDTTSAPFGQGKTKLTSVFQKNPHLHEMVAVFLQPHSSHDAIAKAGEKCFVALYGGDITNDTLNSLRYHLFIRSATNTKVNLARLPPTEDAASHHSYRTYYQVQKWLGTNKNPTDWGWKTAAQGLIPVTTSMDAAPQNLLRLISCVCKKGCSGGCNCRKAGLKCSALCKFCCGKSCQNVPSVNLEDSDDDEDDSIPIFAEPVEVLYTSVQEVTENCSESGPSKQMKL